MHSKLPVRRDSVGQLEKIAVMNLLGGKYLNSSVFESRQIFLEGGEAIAHLRASHPRISSSHQEYWSLLPGQVVS